MDTRQFILITGASSGIGEACVLQLSEHYNLILAGRNHEKLDGVRQKCINADSHLVWVCDLATEREDIMPSLTAFLKENNVVVTTFIHCAGVSKILPFKDFAISYIDEIYNVNFFSAVEITKCLLKRANQKALKNVLLISALFAMRGNMGNSIYASSKGAINSLVYSLALELAPAVRVNALMPGAIETPMTEHLNEEYKTRIEQATPLGMGSTEDVCNYVEFLISDKAKWITGQTLFVDGGLDIKCV